MAVELVERNEGRILEVHVTGPMTANDYDNLTPMVEESIGHYRKIGMLFYMHAFRGGTFSALWQDTRFARRHFSNIERFAIVGDKAWQGSMSAFCKPLTRAQIRYFDPYGFVKEHIWLEDDEPEPGRVRTTSKY